MTLGVSLYTSRIVLNALGVENFGVYSVVAAIVSLFSFLNSAMSSATQRFLAINISLDDKTQLKSVFNAALIIHIGIAFVVLFISETLGLWFVNNKLVLPEGSLFEANVVYQLSILTTLIGITQVPYNALIIARERMNIFAIISVLETVLKLLVVFLLFYATTSKLIVFASLILLVSLIISSVYKYYCYKYFGESKFLFVKDKLLYKSLISYSGWNLIGNFAVVAKGQGINILLNIFFGTLLNAAYGIMIQVQTAVQAFVMNFQTAVNPRIYKLHAQNDLLTAQRLIFSSSKFSFFLLLLIIFPILYNIKYILFFWLSNPPKYAASLVFFSLINLLIESISGPLITSALATGKIKNYQIVVGGILLLNLPISYIFLTVFNDPLSFLYISIILSIVSLIFRVLFLRKMILLDLAAFFKEVIIPITMVSILAIGYYILFMNLLGKAQSIMELVWMSSMNCLYVLIAVYLFGLSTSDRKMLLGMLKKTIGKI